MLCPAPVKILRASFVHAAAIIAFVLATAGMMFFTTPRVSSYVTPAMPCNSALSFACSHTHCDREDKAPQG